MADDVVALGRVKPSEEVFQLGEPSEAATKTATQRKSKFGKGRGKSEGNVKEPKPRRLKSGKVMAKYSRGDPIPYKGVKDKKLGGALKRAFHRERNAVFRLSKAEILHTAEEGFMKPQGNEKLHKVTQDDILEEAVIGVQRKVFSFDLPFGQYSLQYTRNGQHLIAAGRKGHLALLQCNSMQLVSETNLKETIRAVQALQNYTMCAVAQKKYVHIYDHQAVELHCVKDMKFMTHLGFLPYHYLLVAAGDNADLHYRDISTGEKVAVHRTHLGPCRAMCHNQLNGVVHLGHSNGTVTLWTPTVKEPVVKVFCHNGHTTGLACHGNYMITTGADARWKIWDLRKYERLQTYKCFGHAASSIDVSMTGLVSVSFGCHVEVWKDPFTAHQEKPYLTQNYPGKAVASAKFRPYEDVLGVGLSTGFGTLLVPGAGFPNFDSFEASPFENKQQRREREVRSLLDKLQPDSIMLDPNQIGNIDKKVAAAYDREVQAAKEEEEEKSKKTKKKKKMRGADKAGNRKKRKHLEAAKSQRDRTRSRLQDGEAGDDTSADSEGDDDETQEKEGEPAKAKEPQAKAAAGPALSLFYGKRRKKL